MEQSVNGVSRSIQGKTFTIGGRVFANQNSDYRHLFGTVTEFQSGEECGNDPDETYIVCDFEAPKAIGRRQDLEEHFSKLHGCEKTIDDINLGGVVMAADMLLPIADTMPPWEHMEQSPYVLCYQDEGESGMTYGSLGVSNDLGLLLRCVLDTAQKDDLELTAVEEAEDLLCFSYEGKGKYRFVEFEISRAKVYPRAETKEEADRHER